MALIIGGDPRSAGGWAPPAPPSWTPPVPVATPSPILPPPPAAPAALAQPAASAFTPAATTTTTTAAAPLMDVIQGRILNDPSYKQGLETLQTNYDRALARGAQEQVWANEALSRAASRGSGGSSIGAGEAQQAAIDALTREKAARDLALARDRTREVLASRGMIDSGQTQFEQQNLDYDYQMLLKEIDLRAQARQASYAAARADAARAASARMADISAQMQENAVRWQWRQQDLKTALATDKGQLVLQTGERLAGAWFDPNTGMYVGPGGERWDRYGNPVGTPAPLGAPENPFPAPPPAPVAPPAPAAPPPAPYIAPVGPNPLYLSPAAQARAQW